MSEQAAPIVNPTLSAETVAALRQALYGVRRDALSIVRLCEDLLDLPSEKRAIKSQAEQIAERDLAYRERLQAGECCKNIVD